MLPAHTGVGKPRHAFAWPLMPYPPSACCPQTRCCIFQAHFPAHAWRSAEDILNFSVTHIYEGAFDCSLIGMCCVALIGHA